MIARVYIRLPYSFTIPNGAFFHFIEGHGDGLIVRIHPPIVSDKPSTDSDFDSITINDNPAFRADTLLVDFIRDDFDRKKDVDVWDPPIALIEEVVNAFLDRIRYVTKSMTLKPISMMENPDVYWRIEYLDDTGQSIPSTEELANKKGLVKFRFSWTALTPEIWNDLTNLPNDFRIPSWYKLQLDALDALPDIGVAVVLAATSLEVFISQILDLLNGENTTPTPLWKWVNDVSRGIGRVPRPDEQFDGLLRIFTGFSLKDDANLWKAYNNLREARNSFVHEGTAYIKDHRRRILLTSTGAAELVKKTLDITSLVKAHLPEKLQWPEFDHRINVSCIKKIPVK